MSGLPGRPGLIVRMIRGSVVRRSAETIPFSKAGGRLRPLSMASNPSAIQSMWEIPARSKALGGASHTSPEVRRHE